MRWFNFSAFATLALISSSCNSTSGGARGAVAIHDLHEPSTVVNVPTNADDYYRLPFPNDLRIGADGRIDLTRYPKMDGIVGQYIEAFKILRGFGTNSGIYFRFDAALDDKTLPADANASTVAGATAFVVDVTPGSPTFGQRAPVITHYVKPSYDFIGPNWVAMLPFPGLPLREKTTYAAVLTDGLKAADGGPVKRYPDFDAALQKNAASSGDAKIAAAARAYAPFTTWLATQPALAPHVVNATVFTTLDATSIMFKLRKAVYDNVPAPSLTDLKYLREDHAGVDQLYEGHYPGPNFQTGDPPYMPSGGAIAFDAAGVPQVVRMENLRVAMTIPEGTMPAAGWPVVIYAHGTGGNYMSFVNDHSGSQAAKVTATDGSVIAKLAMIGVDEVLADVRDPTHGGADLDFFNVYNPNGARDNPKQGALDDFQLVRLLKSINIPSADMTGQPIKFDPDRLYFKGHSEGSLTGPLFLAAEPEIKAAVLSGAGAVSIYSVLNKTQPVDFPRLIGGILRDPVDEWHPLLSLLQNYLEDSDPANYARYFFKEPPAGFAPKSIYQSLGIVDTYAPVPNGKAMAMASALQPVHPMVDAIGGLDLAKLTWGDAPVVNNVAGGKATGVMLEYRAMKGSDGHFVIFDIPAAIAQSNRFLATHAATGIARLDPP